MFAYCGNSPIIFYDTTGTHRKKDPVMAIDLGDNGLDGDGTELCFASFGWGNGTTSCVGQECSYTTSPGDYGSTGYSTSSSYCSVPSDIYCSNDYNCGYSAVSQPLQNCADIANAAIPGNGPVVGTYKHTIFSRNVIGLGDSSLRTEVSFLNGIEMEYGTKGSIRFDVMQVDSNGVPICAWDYKTGTARLTEARIRDMLEKSGLSIPIFEIR